MKVNMSYRKKIVSIGKELNYLKKDDISYIMNKDISDIQAGQRLEAARIRSEYDFDKNNR